MTEREQLMEALWKAIGEPDTALRREAFEILAASIIETYRGLPEDALAAAVARADRWAEAYRKLIGERDSLRSEVSEAKRWAIHYRAKFRSEGTASVSDWEEEPDWLEEPR